MANINSTLATAAASSLTDGSITTKGRDIAGLVLYARGKIVLPSTLAANDTLTLVAASQLPVGAVVDPLLSFVFAESDPGTALQLDIGTAADPDKYADAMDVNNAGQVWFSASNPLPVAITAPAEESVQTAIFATVKVATTITNNTPLQFAIAYRLTA